MKRANNVFKAVGMTLAVIGSFGGCKSGMARSGEAITSNLSIETHTAGDPGFRVNSHLITGKKDAILVDAQLTRSEAAKVTKLVKDSGKNLKMIFVTHAHPDHFLGLETLKKDFPKAQIVAIPAVAEGIRKNGKKMLEYWKPSYKKDLADRVVAPKPFTGKQLELEGEKIEVIEIKDGESDTAAVLYLPARKTLISGDLTYNEVHLWLAENRPEGWIKNLSLVRDLGAIEEVRTGHGPSADASILKKNEEYIRDFVKFTEAPATYDVALKNLKEEYSSYALPIIAELSVGARLNKK